MPENPEGLLLWLLLLLLLCRLLLLQLSRHCRLLPLMGQVLGAQPPLHSPATPKWGATEQQDGHVQCS
jgi:hypothetical protein